VDKTVVVEKPQRVGLERCIHATEGWVSYLNNDGIRPPKLLIENLEGVFVVELTNQIIRIYCPSCAILVTKSISVKSS
jgi:hypothetical protein